MRYDYIEPFVDTTIRVLDRLIQCDVARGSVSLVRGGDIDGDISILIAVNGHAQGNIIVNMNASTALGICSEMNGEDFAHATPFVMDTISELANMISGHAATALYDRGFDFKVSPPLVVARDGILLKTSGMEIFQVPLFTEYGEITINVAMSTS